LIGGTVSTSRKLLCAAYAAIAVAALIATWSQNIAYLGGGNLLTAFWRDTRVNPASQSITVDIALFFLAAAVFMVIEARKHDIRFVWAYIAGGLLIAISVTFPLFLIARELKLGATDAPRLPVLDKALLAAFTAMTIVFVWWVDLA
jgi:Terpene cyclase DEP1